MGIGDRVDPAVDGVLGARALTKTSSQGAHGQQLLPGEERRRSQRVMIRVPVSLEYAVAGKNVTVEAVTVSVNDHGAMVSCSRPLAVDANLEIVNQRTREKLGCRITRTPVECPEGYLIPVEFLVLSPGFWRISFPSTNWKPVED